MEKRKFDLVKEDIISFEDFKKLNENNKIRPRICKTSYSYEAYPSKLKIINDDTKQVTTFNGKFCGKRVMFKIDHDKELITSEGIVKPPKDPFKRLFWEKGFTGARRVENYTDIKQPVRSFFYIRDSNCEILLVIEPNRKTWWASENLTLEEARLILNDFDDCQV